MNFFYVIVSFISLLIKNKQTTTTKWRAPEEYQRIELTEQIDVWSLGGSMYVLLTGLKPHHEIMDRSKVLYKKTARGGTPYLDPRYAERSYGDKKLLDIIPLCWVYDPKKRITVFELVKILQQAVRENDEYVNNPFLANNNFS